MTPHKHNKGISFPRNTAWQCDSNAQEKRRDAETSFLQLLWAYDSYFCWPSFNNLFLNNAELSRRTFETQGRCDLPLAVSNSKHADFLLTRILALEGE